MHQPEVANTGGVFEVECFEPGQPLEAFKALVGDLGAPEIQPLELGKPFEVIQSLVRDFGSAEFQHLEIGQPLDVYHVVIVVNLVRPPHRHAAIPGLGPAQGHGNQLGPRIWPCNRMRRVLERVPARSPQLTAW